MSHNPIDTTTVPGNIPIFQPKAVSRSVHISWSSCRVENPEQHQIHPLNVCVRVGPRKVILSVTMPDLM